jgi:hypothetical protein
MIVIDGSIGNWVALGISWAVVIHRAEPSPLLAIFANRQRTTPTWRPARPNGCVFLIQGVVSLLRNEKKTIGQRCR